MLILFIATTFGVGSTLIAIDNLGQIGNSLGYPNKSITTFVSLVSIWNYLGRVVSGFASEIFLTKYKFPCPLMLTLVLLLSCVGHLRIAFGVPDSLYFASIILGFCFRVRWRPIVASKELIMQGETESWTCKLSSLKKKRRRYWQATCIDSTDLGVHRWWILVWTLPQLKGF